MVIIATIAAVLLTGSLVYCVLVVLAARKYLAAPLPPGAENLPISVLKPLCGHDEGLEENLRSFFEQAYSHFEVLLAVHREDDAATELARRIIAEYRGRIEARLIISGESPVPNAKAYSLGRLVREAKYDLLVMSDSDVRVAPGLLSHLSREFHGESVGLITCPYRAVPGRSLWSRLEAVGMNTELLGGVVVARMLEGMRFALGCTIGVRRSVLDAMGGFGYLQEFLAEDFVIGQRAAEMGNKVVLSSAVIEHRIGSQGMVYNLGHRLRWARSTRRSRPTGYWGQAFTYPVPWAILLAATFHPAWPVILLAVAMRIFAASATAWSILRDPLLRRQWWLLPLQDLLGFVVWMGGFLGDTVVWRDRKCTLLRDGRLQVNP